MVRFILNVIIRYYDEPIVFYYVIKKKESYLNK